MGPCGSQARVWINEGKEGYVIGKGGSPEKKGFCIDDDFVRICSCVNLCIRIRLADLLWRRQTTAIQ
jgi:hypothetical protein